MVTLDHVGIVVRDLDASVSDYGRLLGAAEFAREDLSEQGVVVAALRCGDGMIELLSPTREDTGVARFLHARGESLHHVAFRVKSVSDELDRLRRLGARLVDETPRVGLGGRLVAFVHPESAHGVLTELVEPMEGFP